MFDLGNAIVLGLLVAGLVALAKSLIFGTNPERIQALVCLIIGIVAVLLVGASDFSHENVVLEHPLDTLNIWSQLLIGVLLGGLASGVWQVGVKAVSNIGQNNTTTEVGPPSPPPTEKAA